MFKKSAGSISAESEPRGLSTIESLVSIERNPQPSQITEPQLMVINGVRYRVVYDTYGPYIRSDGKGVIEGVRFTGVVPA
jgi:hypothetical protein